MTPAWVRCAAAQSRRMRGVRTDIVAWRQALEARYGPQSGDALVFPDLDTMGPVAEHNYKNWTRRPWRAACKAAAVGEHGWVAKARVYDLRHTAISYALREHYTTTEVAQFASNTASNTASEISKAYAHVIADARGRDWDVNGEIVKARKIMGKG
jgi:integrase